MYSRINNVLWEEEPPEGITFELFKEKNFLQGT